MADIVKKVRSPKCEYPNVYYKHATNVFMILFDGAIRLPALLKAKVETALCIEKSKMNGAKAYNYCVDIRLPLKKGVVATLTVYAAKIEIYGIRPLNKVRKIVTGILDDLEARYRYKEDKHFDVTLYTLGKAKSMKFIQKKIVAALDRDDLEMRKHELVFKGAFIHAKGLRNADDFELAQNRFLELFATPKIAPRLEPLSICSIMSNGTYLLGWNLNIWKVATLITNMPGFDDGKAFCLYDNLEKPFQVLIILKVEVSEEQRKLIRRDNIETTFIVKDTGSVTQFNPSQETGVKSFELFIRAMEMLASEVRRNPNTKKKR